MEGSITIRGGTCWSTYGTASPESAYYWSGSSLSSGSVLDRGSISLWFSGKIGIFRFSIKNDVFRFINFLIFERTYIICFHFPEKSILNKVYTLGSKWIFMDSQRKLIFFNFWSKMDFCRLLGQNSYFSIFI